MVGIFRWFYVEGQPGARWRRLGFAGLVVGCLVALDVVSKTWAENRGLVLINQGVSFGLAADWAAPALVTVTGVLVAVAGVQVWRARDWSWWGWVGLVAGGVGNGLDRWWFAGVRDWLPIPGTPLHNNLADYWVTIGVGMVLLAMIRSRSSATPPANI